MKYREFGKTGLKVSALGFGTMRLPLLEDGVTVDEKEAVRIIRHAIDSGVNYVDTAYPYHQGTSEIVVGKALRDGYRDKVFLADKSPIWKLEKESDFDSILEEQLQKLQTDHIDFYLLHALNKERFEKIKNLHLIDHMLEARKAGKIRYLGFSFHDDLEVFKQIVDYTDQWDFCQIQYNYIDEYSQAGVEGLRYANAKGLPVIIMEPLRGGRLVNLLPESAKELFRNDEEGRTPAELALKWLYNQPEVTCVLSGMNSMEMVEQNVKTASESHVGCLTTSDAALIEQVKEEIKKHVKVGCTGCGYCMPCPRGVDIPGTFRCYNAMYSEGKKSGRRDYLQCTAFRKDTASASQCVGCGKCETHCPQHLEIRKELKCAASELEDVKYKVMKSAIRIFKLW